MANKDASFGLKPVRMIGGAPYNGGQSRYRIASSYGTSIFQGDLVMQTNAGSTKTGISGDELDVSTGATTATLPLKAIDLSQDPNNQDVGSSNTNVYCVIQNSIFGVKSAGLA